MATSLVRFLADDYFMSDEFLVTFVPILVYWAYSGMYMMMPASLDRYRLHPKGESELINSVSKIQAAKGVLVQQAAQSAVAIFLFALARGSGAGAGAVDAVDAPPTSSPSLPVTAVIVASRLLVAMVVMDTYQYFTHRYLHHNKFLYRHIHSVHHRVVVTHAFGALYTHPLDGINDTVGSLLAYFISGMSPPTAVFFFSLAVMKVIDDHCGMWLPGNPFHIIFANNSATHDFHHQLGGGKYNFSKPFFFTWDKIMGTHMPVAVVERRGEEQGLQGYVIKTNKDK